MNSHSPNRLSFGLAGLFAALVLGVATPAAATDVFGSISVDTTWDITSEPYVMTGNVVVQSGVTLTIAPGVTVQGSSSAIELRRTIWD